MKRLVVLITFLLFHIESFSQCAMCKAVAESNPIGKDSFFSGLNSGILYLMFIPYMLLFIAFVYNYLNRKQIF